MASPDPGDAASIASSDPAALLAAAKAEVELMMKHIASQSQAPALFSTTLSEACRGQHLGDVVKILVEMGGIGPALSEMHAMQSLNCVTNDSLDLQGMNQMSTYDFQPLLASSFMNHIMPLDMHSMHGFNHMSSQFAFPFMHSGCQTPRSREDLSDVKSVDLELVGTTLVAKTANEQAKLDVRFRATACFWRSCVASALFS
jgi:hypothetical protein